VVRVRGVCEYSKCKWCASVSQAVGWGVSTEVLMCGGGGCRARTAGTLGDSPAMEPWFVRILMHSPFPDPHVCPLALGIGGL
jgi:hypothetical protein